MSFEDAKKAAKEKGAVRGVSFPKGDMVFVSQPQRHDWDEMRTYKDTPEFDAQFERYVMKCIVSIVDKDGAPLTPEQLKERQGFAAIFAGVGTVINRLAGGENGTETFL